MTSQIKHGLAQIIDFHTSGDDDIEGPAVDGEAIAFASFKYAMSLAIENLTARSVDNTPDAIIAAIAELKELSRTSVFDLCT